ncbi:hypothetical protein BsWGS_12992 [Bradybaena similaris]
MVSTIVLLCSLLLTGFVLVPVIIFLWLTVLWIKKDSSQNVPKIYAQPGFFYPLKYHAIRAMLWLRKLQNARSQYMRQANSANAGYGVRSRNSFTEMDSVQVLPANQPKFPRIGLLELPSLPDTWLSDANSLYGYTAGGLTIKPLRPMETWSLKYDGMMRIAETDRIVKVSLNLIWKAYTKLFDFDTDLHPHVMADGIAREKWTRKYFDTLKRLHQTHYEQFGEITGSVHVSSYQVQEVKVQGVRDHSYGNIRDWGLFHRYALNYAHLEDNTALCVGAICMPVTLSRLVVGYVFHPDGTMDPVTGTDFEFYNHGDDGNPPDKLVVNFKAGNKQYHLVCEVIQCPIFYMGKDWDAKIHERFCNYTVNGVKGWGISEWDYRNYDGKAAELKRLKDRKKEP